MNIISYNRQEIEEGIEKAQKRHQSSNEDIRLLLAPEVINKDNFECACDIYSRIALAGYETAVVIESYGQSLDKKLPMASNKYFETPLGSVPANDFMRNEFCDEDDDFYIHDGAFNKEISLFQQLMMLQTLRDDFSVVSVQVADDNSAIIKELASVLEEVLASRSALLVFCCELENEFKEEFQKVKELVYNKNQSGLLYYLNSGKSNIKGATAFIAGVLVAHKWGLDLTFLESEQDLHGGSLLTAYAERQRVII